MSWQGLDFGQTLHSSRVCSVFRRRLWGRPSSSVRWTWKRDEVGRGPHCAPGGPTEGALRAGRGQAPGTRLHRPRAGNDSPAAGSVARPQRPRAAPPWPGRSAPLVLTKGRRDRRSSCLRSGVCASTSAFPSMERSATPRVVCARSRFRGGLSRRKRANTRASHSCFDICCPPKSCQKHRGHRCGDRCGVGPASEQQLSGKGAPAEPRRRGTQLRANSGLRSGSAFRTSAASPVESLRGLSTQTPRSLKSGRVTPLALLLSPQDCSSSRFCTQLSVLFPGKFHRNLDQRRVECTNRFGWVGHLNSPALAIHEHNVFPHVCASRFFRPCLTVSRGQAFHLLGQTYF